MLLSYPENRNKMGRLLEDREHRLDTPHQSINGGLVDVPSPPELMTPPWEQEDRALGDNHELHPVQLKNLRSRLEVEKGAELQKEAVNLQKTHLIDKSRKPRYAIASNSPFTLIWDQSKSPSPSPLQMSVAIQQRDNYEKPSKAEMPPLPPQTVDPRERQAFVLNVVKHTLQLPSPVISPETLHLPLMRRESIRPLKSLRTESNF